MSARVSLEQRIADYLAERRRLGFELRSWDTMLATFARYVALQHHRGPLTADLMIDWAKQDKWQRGTPSTWAVRLAKIRHFARYLKQFEPATEVPEELTFGPEPGRLAPHIFHDQEVIDLLAAAGVTEHTLCHLRNPVRPDGINRPAGFGSAPPA